MRERPLKLLEDTREACAEVAEQYAYGWQAAEAVCCIEIDVAVDQFLAEMSEDWQLVPIEPTYEMMDEAFDGISLSDAHTYSGVQRHVWAYMLSKAPKWTKETYEI